MMQNSNYSTWQRGNQARSGAACTLPQSEPACECADGRESDMKLWGQMSREQLLCKISQWKFAMVETGLYLDTHPSDTAAIRYFQENSKWYREAMKFYAKKYGPLTLAHAHTCEDYWNWVNQPWPWQ